MTTTSTLPRLYTRSQAAELLGLSVMRVTQLAQDGALAGRKLGQAWLFTIEDLLPEMKARGIV
jgi:excisionase family DNA binding protein